MPKEISFKLHPEHVLGFFGPNESGKTIPSESSLGCFLQTLARFREVCLVGIRPRPRFAERQAVSVS